jgi:hypothetical protein
MYYHIFCEQISSAFDVAAVELVWIACVNYFVI